MSKGRCRSCGRALSTPDQAGDLCAACASAAGFKQLLPARFFDRPALRKALAEHDFGPVFEAIREHTGLSQANLAALVSLNQSRVSAIERRAHKVTGLATGARISTAFAIPAQYLGFYAEPGSLDVEEVSWVDRRDFITLALAAALGSNLHPELEHLGNQLPARLKPIARKRIGVKDVEEIEEAADYYRRKDLEYGSGFCHSAALALLHEVRTYETIDCHDTLRPRLWVATAELSWVAGWLAYDLEDHDAARRLWTYAQQAASKGSSDPRSTDLSVNILLDMAHQSLHLWHPAWIPAGPEQRRLQQQHLDDALRYAQTAATIATNRQHPASTVTTAYIASVTAWCWAARGDADATARSISRSEDLYADVDRRNLPPWASFLTAAEISAQHGHSAYLLSTHDRDHAPQAIDQLTAAINGHALAHARSKAVALPTLAGAYLQAGDHETAAQLCDTAIQQINGLTSRRCYTRLGDLDRIAAHYPRSSVATDLRAQIAATLAATS